jgi:hypothetical protein
MNNGVAVLADFVPCDENLLVSRFVDASENVRREVHLCIHIPPM